MNRGARLIWGRWPALVARVSRPIGVFLADGGYLVRWPATSIALPVLALGVGALVGLARSQGEITYTFSLLAMALMVAIAGLGAGLGVYVLLAYAVCDFFVYPHQSSQLGERPGMLVSYLLLAVVLVLIPLATGVIRNRTLSDPRRLNAARNIIELGLAAMVGGLLVFAWTQSASVLIRPIFVWGYGGASLAGISPVQQQGWVLAIIGAAVAVLRASLERLSASAPTRPSVFAIELHKKGEKRPLPMPMVVLAEAALLTLLMTGLVTSLLEVPPLFIGLAGVSLLRRLLAARVPSYALLLSKVPLLIRLMLGMAASALVARLSFDSTQQVTIAFWPDIAAALVSILLLTLLTLDLAIPQDRLRGKR